MQFLTSDQTTQGFSELVSGVDRNHAAYRVELLFHPEAISHQKRIGCGSPVGMHLNHFSHALLGWFKGEGARLLWVSHWEDGFLGLVDIFNAARAGLGADSGLEDTRGHWFEPDNFQELDHTVLPIDGQKRVNAASSLISLVHMGEWDGWLIEASSKDRIEFWEGNVFFYSNDNDQLEAATSIIKAFKCGEVR